MTGVPAMGRSFASTHWVELGWSAGTLTRNGALGTSAPLNVGAGPPESWAIGLAIVQTTRPLQESKKPPRPGKNPQLLPVATSGPSIVPTKVSLVPALLSRLIVGWTVSARNGFVAGPPAPVPRRLNKPSAAKCPSPFSTPPFLAPHRPPKTPPPSP